MAGDPTLFQRAEHLYSRTANLRSEAYTLATRLGLGPEQVDTARAQPPMETPESIMLDATENIEVAIRLIEATVSYVGRPDSDGVPGGSTAAPKETAERGRW